MLESVNVFGGGCVGGSVCRCVSPFTRVCFKCLKGRCFSFYNDNRPSDGRTDGLTLIHAPVALNKPPCILCNALPLNPRIDLDRLRWRITYYREVDKTFVIYDMALPESKISGDVYENIY